MEKTVNASPSPLRSRHQQILRYVFEGLSNNAIAGLMGMAPVSISLITRSPIFKGELERLRLKAEESMTNMPAKIMMLNELNATGVEAVRFNRKLMKDENVNVRLRSKIATHFSDRIVFGKSADEDDGKTDYRRLLSKLNEVERALQQAVVTPVQVIDVASSSEPVPATVHEMTKNGGRIVSDEEVA